MTDQHTKDATTGQCYACGKAWCNGCDTCPCVCKTIKGVAPDQPIITNAKGGKQSESPYSLISSFPHKAILAVAKVIRYGLTRYAPDNWRLISRNDHLNHALAHIHAYGAGDRSDDHLEHAACRLLFALETEHEKD